jgi:hypothetical protein
MESLFPLMIKTAAPGVCVPSVLSNACCAVATIWSAGAVAAQGITVPNTSRIASKKSKNRFIVTSGEAHLFKHSTDFAYIYFSITHFSRFGKGKSVGKHGFRTQKNTFFAVFLISSPLPVKSAKKGREFALSRPEGKKRRFCHLIRLIFSTFRSRECYLSATRHIEIYRYLSSSNKVAKQLASS